MAITFPKNVKIGPIDYEVRDFDGFDDEGTEVDGLQIYDESLILLRKELGDVPKQITLVHEILHAVFDNNSIMNTEENHNIVKLIAPAIVDLLKSNPKLVKYLTKKRGE